MDNSLTKALDSQTTSGVSTTALDSRPPTNRSQGYAPERIQYGIDRYGNETRRLYRVLETQLGRSTSGFLVGDRLTIADIISWSWVKSHGSFTT